MKLFEHVTKELLVDLESQPTRVLLVDNSEQTYWETNRMLLGIQKSSYLLEWAATYQEGLMMLMEGRHDICLVSYALDEKDGLEFIQESQSMECMQPMIILHAEEAREVDLQGMQLGAWAYLVRTQLTASDVDRAIRYALKHRKVLDNLLEIQRHREKFVATLTHDLKTPIKAEYRIFELLLMERFGPLNPDQQLVIQEMTRSNRFMNQMVDNLLTAFKFEEGQMILRMEILDLNELVFSTISRDLSGLAQDKEQELVLDLLPDMPPIPVDALEIKRVIYNLVQNAITYTPDGGKIHIYSRFQENHAMITVADSGPGIEEAIRKSLFEPYSSTAKRYQHVGTGLGLYISRKIIEAHNGELRVVSQLGEGSQFTFTLPAHQDEKSRVVIL